LKRPPTDIGYADLKLRDASDSRIKFVKRHVRAIGTGTFLILFFTGKLWKFLMGTLNVFFFFIMVGPLIGSFFLKAAIKNSQVHVQCPTCLASMTGQKGREKKCMKCQTPFFVGYDGESQFLGSKTWESSRADKIGKRGKVPSLVVIDTEIVEG